MIGVPQLFEDRWQQGGGGNTPPAAPVKRGRGRPRKHPLPQDKSGGVAPRRPTKGSRRVHTDDEWSDWNESSYDTWQPEWTPQQPNVDPSGLGGGGGNGMYPPPPPPGSGGYPPGSGASPPLPGGASTPSTPGSPMTAPSACGSTIGPTSSMMSDLSPAAAGGPPPPPGGDVQSDWRDDYCYSMTYDVNYILSTTSPENTQVVPRLPPTTDQSGNRLFHWHANPLIPRASAQTLYALTGYVGSEEGPPPSPTSG